MSEQKMVFLWNHADPDESFVAMLTDDEIKQAEQEYSQFSQELYDLAKSREVKIPSICYYA